jgi:outer membrane protein OmpU
MRENQMQKVLLASTALVLTTGWAMADVTNAGDGVGASIALSGEAKIGVVGNDLDTNEVVDLAGNIIPDFTVRDNSAQFFTDIDLKFTMTGMTDGGLEFGAEIDIDENSAFDGYTQGGETLWLKGAFGNLYMGDTDGAFDWAMQESIIGGSLDDVNEHAGYSGNAGLDGLIYDGQIARYDYSWGGFGVAVSAELDDFNEGDPILGLGGKYTWSGSGVDATIGAGIQSVSDIGERPIGADLGATIYGISGNLDFGAIQFIADYSHIDYDDATNPFTLDDVDNGSHWGVALGYETGPWLFAVNYGHAENFIERDTDIDNTSYLFGDSEGYALTANYDLGGGASLQGAIAHNTRGVFEEVDLDPNYMTYSFGVAMSF